MRSFKRLAVLAGALIGLGFATSAPVTAADYTPPQIYLPQAPPDYVAPPSWTGPRLFVFGGYSRGHILFEGKHHEWELPFRGFDLGVGFGVNYQPPGSRVVIGADIDIMRSWQRGEYEKTWGCGCYEYTFHADWGPTWVATGTARLGFLLTDNLMVYGRAGFSGGRTTFNASLTATNGQQTWDIWDATAAVAGFGRVWGIGVEARLGDRVSAFAEFRRIVWNNASIGGGGNTWGNMSTTQTLFLAGVSVALGR